MEEIKFFGKAVQAGGRLAREVASLMGNTKLKGSNIYCPFTYLYTMDTARHFDSSSFEWPVHFRAALTSDEVYYPPVEVPNHKALAERILDLERKDPEAAVLISIPPSQLGGVELCSSFFFYLARNYLLIHNIVDNCSFIINTNNTAAFKKMGLDKNLVYRMAQIRHPVTCEASFYIESIFEYNDSRLEPIREKTYYKALVADEEARKLFLDGYRTGWLVGRKNYCFPSRTIKTAYLSDPHSFGYILALRIRFTIERGLKNFGIAMGADQDLSYALSLKKIYGETAMEKIELGAKLHNAILEENNKDIFELLQKYLRPSDKVGLGLLPILLAATQVASDLRNKKALPVVSGLGEINPFVGLDVEDAEITFDLKTEKSQIRIADSGTNHVKMRWQFYNLAVLSKVKIGDKPQAVKKYEVEKLEHDFMLIQEDLKNSDGPNTIKKLVKRFDKMKHTEESQAGTGVMYVPVEIIEGNLVHTQSNKIILPKSILTDVYTKAGWLKLPHQKQ
jgi:hypothetical protein